MPAPTCLPAPSALREALRAHVASLLGEDDPDFVADLADTFCTSAAEGVAAARAAAARGDAVGLRSTAHQMRGSALNVGLDHLAEAWARVEHGDAAPDDALDKTECAIDALAG